VKGDETRPRSDSFEWLLQDRRHRRRNLRWIARSIQEGWLRGPEKKRQRSALMFALRQLDRRKLSDREELALLRVYLAMQGDL
jgi:hypothetical protein